MEINREELEDTAAELKAIIDRLGTYAHMCDAAMQLLKLSWQLKSPVLYGQCLQILNEMRTEFSERPIFSAINQRDLN